MNCANARANFSAYVEHELSEQERRQTAAHLARCPRCSRDLFAMQKAMSLIRWVPRADARPGFEERLHARLRAEREVAPASRWWPRFTELGAGLRQLFGESWAPAPAMAVAVAALLGTGSGAYITHHVLSQRPPATMAERPAVHGVSTTEAPALPAAPESFAGSMATPDRAAESLPGSAATAATSPPPRPEAPNDLASATPSAPSVPQAATLDPATRSERTTAATVRPPASRPAGAASMTVASATPARRPRHDRSARPGDRMEVAPWAANSGQPIEGPPSVSQVEYILNLVDVNQERVLQLPATAVVSGSTVTF